MHEQENGVPQGSVLSVTLFILVVNGATATIPSCVEPLLFVDDITVLFRSKDIESGKAVMQSCIKKLHKWATNVGFTFSPLKTKYVVFTCKRKPIPPLLLELNGCPIDRVSKIRYLGLVVDEKLTWRSHIDHLRVACQKDLNILRVVQANKWGADRTTLLRLYRQLIRAKLDYACIVYGSAKEKDLDRLNPIHNSGVRLALGAFKTSPIKSILVEADETPLPRRREMLLLRYCYRLLQHPQNLTSRHIQDPKFINYYRRKPHLTQPFSLRFQKTKAFYNLTYTTVSEHIISASPPWMFNPPKIRKLKSKRNHTQPDEILQEHNKIKNYYPQYTSIYTDGSKTNTGAGCAFVCDLESKLFTCSLRSSICTIELEAIHQAVRYSIERQITKALIFTDSSSSLSTLQNLYTQNSTAIKIRQEISNQNLSVSFVWVPSHSSIPGNEKADQCAKDAILSGLSIETPVAAKNLYGDFKSAIRKDWQTEWTEVLNNKLNFIKPILGSWNTSCRKNRSEETVLCRLRLGHTRMTHKYLFTRELEPAKCTLCNDILTVSHLLHDCHRLDDLRTKHHLPSTLPELLADNEKIVKSLFNFLKEAEIFDHI